MKIMKTNKTLLAVLTSIALVSLTGVTYAQYKATGADGITASPKLRETLNARATAPLASAPSAKSDMPCGSCKEEYTTRVDRTARGANKPATTVVNHLCPACETTWKITGVGKNATSVAVHQCKATGENTATCCVAQAN
jgi:hypothetical protein